MSHLLYYNGEKNVLLKYELKSIYLFVTMCKIQMLGGSGTIILCWVIIIVLQNKEA